MFRISHMPIGLRDHDGGHSRLLMDVDGSAALIDHLHNQPPRNELYLFCASDGRWVRKTDKIPPRARGNSHSCWTHPGQLSGRTEGINVSTITDAHHPYQYSPFSFAFMSRSDITLSGHLHLYCEMLERKDIEEAAYR